MNAKGQRSGVLVLTAGKPGDGLVSSLFFSIPQSLYSTTALRFSNVLHHTLITSAPFLNPAFSCNSHLWYSFAH